MALVLMRRKDEGVRIAGPAKVYIHSVKGNQVRLRFEAERGVEIVRLEIDDRKEERPNE